MTARQSEKTLGNPTLRFGLEAREGWILALTDRFGLARCVVILGGASILASIAIAFAVYAIVGLDPFAEPVAILLPVLCPLLIAPPLIVNAARHSMAIRDQRVLIERQNQTLERTLAEKDRIISLVGHDLRGHLNLIMGFAQLIGRQTATIPPERLADYANEIQDAGRKTNEVLTDLLNWGQARTGRLNPVSETLSIDAVIERVVASLQRDAGRKQVTVHPPAGGSDLRVDRIVAESAVRNVLSNAIKFSHGGGAVTIETAEEDGTLLITITDQGVGIDATQLHRLNAGQLTDSTEGTSREVGNGLGLAICRDLIEGRGGHIAFASAPGDGTTVKIVMPASAVQQTAE